MVVHHIEVYQIGTGGDDVFHFLAQAGEVGRQNTGGDAVVHVGVVFIKTAIVAILPQCDHVDRVYKSDS